MALLDVNASLDPRRPASTIPASRGRRGVEPSDPRRHSAGSAAGSADEAALAASEEEAALAARIDAKARSGAGQGRDGEP